MADLYKLDAMDKIVYKMISFPSLDRDNLEQLVEQSKSVMELCLSINDMAYKHHAYGELAVEIYMKDLHRNLLSFSDTMLLLAKHNVLDTKFLLTIVEHKEFFNSMIRLRLHNDYKFTFQAIITMSTNYLAKIDDKIVESPQFMYARVAIHIWNDNLQAVDNTYGMLSEQDIIHASPTLFNACFRNGQLASCFLVQLKSDTADGIFETITECSSISRCGGGIGVCLTGLRSNKSKIQSTQNKSKGIKPMIKVLNEVVTYIDQGGRRPGSAAIYLEPYHGDIIDFINIKRGKTIENIFNALWLSDIFIERVKSDEEFSLFDQPHTDTLMKLYGDRFNEHYLMLEKQQKAVGKIKAREIFDAMLTAQLESGTPYILFKDTINKFSNQSNVGTIKTSNLCTEIVEYTDSNETAVCNLASVNLPKFVSYGKFSFIKLELVIRQITRNLDRVIDVTLYPSKAAKFSNLKHRPIGIGIQGFQDLLFMLNLPYDSEKSRQLNISIAETIYYASLDESIELAKEYGPYETYVGSDLHKGILHFHHYNVKPERDYTEVLHKLTKYGARNSLRVAYMPGASTAGLLGSYECFEPLHSNFYIKQVLKGNCKIVNIYLQKYLISKGLWNDDIIKSLNESRGSIQKTNLSIETKKLFRTVFEIDQKILVDMNADRAPFIDQSQSANIYLSTPDKHYLGNLILYAHSKKVKGIYYIRTTPPIETICTSCS